jgi:site-specific recombinase
MVKLSLQSFKDEKKLINRIPKSFYCLVGKLFESSSILSKDKFSRSVFVDRLFQNRLFFV